MNKRIQELTLRTDAWCEQNLPANWTDDVDQYLPLWNAKFAELIVRECDRYACNAWEHGPLLGRDLLIHFGIVELSDEQTN